MSGRIVVIGASAAGLRAAARAKRLRPQLEIVVLDRRQIISLGACGLPHFLSGELESVLPLRTTPWGAIRDPAFFRDAKGLDVRIGQEVTVIDRQASIVRHRDVESGEEGELPWDALVLATGARPRSLPGIARDHPRVSCFTTAEDALRWRQALERGSLRSVAVIGAGPLGIELAEAFTSLWGCQVELIEALDCVLGGMLDPQLAALVQRHLEQQGVQVHTGRHCVSLEEHGDGLRIETNRGTIEAQHAICAIGFEPVVELAREAGLDIGSTGGIAVDELLRTSDPRIFAGGDCIEVTQQVSGRPAHVPLGSLANRQGRAIGDNLCGRQTRFGPVVGSCAVKVFELGIATTGLSQAACERQGLRCEAVYGTFSDKAHYHPDDRSISLKLVFESDTERLLGLQGVGRGEVVKRVDVCAGLIRHNGKLEDLLDLEFCYAPPFAPAVDPLYSLGCAALNQVRDGVRCASPDRWSRPGPLLDVRSTSEVEAAPVVDAATRIPLECLRGRTAEIPPGEDLLVFCAKGPRSAEAARILQQVGHEGIAYIGGGVSMRSV